MTCLSKFYIADNENKILSLRANVYKLYIYTCVCTGRRKQDPTTKSKRVTCVTPGDESKILACHRKQNHNPPPPPSKVDACKRIKYFINCNYT